MDLVVVLIPPMLIIGRKTTPVPVGSEPFVLEHPAALQRGTVPAGPQAGQQVLMLAGLGGTLTFTGSGVVAWRPAERDEEGAYAEFTMASSGLVHPHPQMPHPQMPHPGGPIPFPRRGG